MQTLEEYLTTQRHSYPTGRFLITNFSLKIQAKEGGGFRFYVHPAHVDGETRHFALKGDMAQPLD